MEAVRYQAEGGTHAQKSKVLTQPFAHELEPDSVQPNAHADLILGLQIRTSCCIHSTPSICLSTRVPNFQSCKVETYGNFRLVLS